MTDTPDATAIELENVTRTFGVVAALDGLDLEVRRGDRFGLLGPNGSGKTTTIGLLLNFLRPTTGRVTVFGHDAQREPTAVKRRTGALPEGFTPYPKLTGLEHVQFVRGVRDVDVEPEHYLHRVGLLDAADQKAGEYSRGMTRRLGLAMALVGEPDLLVLDEPTAGLDPHGVTLLRRIIHEENDRGATVFFSSHVLSQVEAVCDRIGILEEGRLVAEGNVQELHDAVDGEITLHASVRTDDSPSAVRDLVGDVDGVRDVSVEGSELVAVCETEAVSARVLAAIDRSGATVASFETDGRSLERVFESYTDQV